MFTRNICKMTSQSVLKKIKSFASATSFGRLFHLLIMRTKKECFKLFKVADVK